MESFVLTGTAARLPLNGGVLTVSFPAQGGVRLQYGAGLPAPAWCPVLAGEPECLPCTAAPQQDGACVRAGQLAVLVRGDGALQVLEADTVRWHTPPAAFALQGPGAALRFYSPASDAIYGLGQDPQAKLDHNHQERRMWNQWGGHAHSGNCGIGFLMSTGGYGMLLAQPSAARFCFNESSPQPLDPLGEAMVPSPWGPARPQPSGEACVESQEALDLFLLLGPPPLLLRQYYGLTGFPGLMPKWAYGFLQCRNRYLNEAELLETARRLRAEDVPCDCLIIDWLWFAEFGDLEWRDDDWPHPQEMLAALAAEGFHAASAQHPFIAPEGKYYEQLRAEGCLNEVPPGKRVTYDHTSPHAREIWWQKTAALYRQGLRGYWTDMGELEEHFEGTRSAAGGRLHTHNAYSLLWAQGLYEGQRRDFGTRPFLLARSGCAGLQKYGAALWSGDVDASWQVLREQVVLGQTMALSGIPWWGTDIGGFLTMDGYSPELYVRWMEWGVFCGLFRTHGTRPGNEPWSFGPGAQRQIGGLIRLRYMLLPYVYSLAMDCALHGTPLVRPMAYEFPTDAEARRWEGQFLFGPSLLVAPVTQPGARSRQVYLPAGQWRHWWSGEAYGPGLHTVPAPLGAPPIFVRAGAAVPIFTEIGRNAAACGGLCLLAVPGGEGTFDYYDDDGEGFGYEQGAYTHVRFTNTDGAVQARALRGEMPAYAVRPFTAMAAPQAFAADCDFQGDTGELTLTFLRPAKLWARLEPEEGWRVTGCSAGGCTQELYEQRYLPQWAGAVDGAAGDTVRWQLTHVDALRRVGVQSARLILGEGKDEQCLTLQWDTPSLSAPQVLGCLPPGASAQGFAPERDPGAAAYSFGGRTWRWMRDPLAAHTCFGYVDLRRFGTYRQGEAMAGEMWVKEILYSKTAQTASFTLRYDSPVTLWLNGEQVFCGREKNAPRVPLALLLRPGQNVLILRQIADIPRPYSGTEFGYQLCLVGKAKIYAVK